MSYAEDDIVYQKFVTLYNTQGVQYMNYIHSVLNKNYRFPLGKSDLYQFFVTPITVNSPVRSTGPNYPSFVQL